MQDCLIAAHDLACRRGYRILFRGVSTALRHGEALQVVGANGIGKSSLLRILAGLLPSFEGSVERKEAAGLVDDRPALDPHLPLAEALGFWRRLDRSALDTAARLGLDGLLDVPVRYLSTGQRKRAALARLVVQQAPIWLLDEPLNGLDADGARLAETIVAGHCASGGACIIASHQPFALPGLRSLTLADFAA